ncbi:MAG: hypothetical protein WCC06_11860 [Candidatus Aminicenantales bacterium]
MRKFNLNLASEPLRNRRFFRLLFWSLAAAVLCLSVASVVFYLSERARLAGAQKDLADVHRTIRITQKEREEFAVRTQEISQKYAESVDFFNAVIVKKCFSWVEFFTLLENALPASSYIVSLSPLQLTESKMEWRMKVVSPHLQGLLELVHNLQVSQFKNITVKNEARDADAQLLAEITLAYERTL